MFMNDFISKPVKNQGAMAVMKDYHPPDKEIGKRVSKRSIERNPGVKSATPASIKIGERRKDKVKTRA